MTPAQPKARGGRVQSVARYFSKGELNIPGHRGESATTAKSLSPSAKRKFDNVLSLQSRQSLKFDNMTLPEHQPSRGMQIISELESQAKRHKVKEE